MPLSARSTTPTPLVIPPPPSELTATPAPPVFSSSYASGASGSNVDLSMAAESPSRSYIDRGYTTPARGDSLSPAHSPRASTRGAALTDASYEGYQSEEAELDALQNRLLIETKIKDGAENLLQVFKFGVEKEGLRAQVTAELAAANREIDRLYRRIAYLKGSVGQPAPPSEIEEDESLTDEDSRTALAGTLEALHSLSDPQAPTTSNGASIVRQDQKIEILNAIAETVQRVERVKWEISKETVAETLLPCLADSESSLVRAAAYRTIRHLSCDPADATALIEQGLEIFAIKTFARNPATAERERTEALLLCRSWLSFPSRSVPLTPGLVRTLIALCENTDEKLRFLALETLTELAVLDTHLLARSEGLRPVLQAFVDGPYDCAPHIAMAFLPIMDLPHTRQVLRPGLDIEIAIGTFINMGYKAPSSAHDEKLRTCAGIVGSYLKTWTGLMYLSTNDKQAIRSFLGAIASSSSAVREAVLDTLFDLFRIDYKEHSPGNQTPTSRKSADAVRARARSDSASRVTKPVEEGLNRLNLVEHFLGLLLVIFVEAGMLDMLMASPEKTEGYQSKAAVLVGELLALSTRVLPVKYGTQWQTLPRIFNMASHFENALARWQSSSLLQNIDKYIRLQARQQKASQTLQNARARANSLDDPLARGQRHVESSKIRQGMQIDDLAWKNLLLESQVLVTKEHQKWNFEAILEAVEGPLLNATRLNEAIKGTKFLRRVIAFFYPFERRYSDLENNPHNLRWTRLGCALLTTLVSSPDGVAFLAQDRLLKQIADCLGQLDPNFSSSISDPLFGERSFAATVSSGYFAMLGTLSKYQEGLRLMEKAKVFTLLYHLSDLRGRDDIITAAIENLSYVIDGHARVVLSKALNSPYKHIRLFATKHLGTLMRDAPANQDWLINLLVTQIYDTSLDVREATVTILNEVCQSTEVLEAVVATRPSLDHLGAMGAPLLFRFLSTSVGVQYLHEIEFIERELDHWFHEFNDLYVIQLELSLAQGMRIGVRDDGASRFDGTAPLHFYGELVRTAEGRMILQGKGHFKEFVETIRTYGLEDQDPDLLAKLKSVLWAVGHIGSTAGGVEFLEHEGVVVDIIHIACQSKVLSIRGTCFFVLGLIASSIEGAILLESCDWNVAYTPVGTPMGYCFPADLDSFLAMPAWSTRRLSLSPFHELAPPAPHLEKEIITAIANLSNNLLTHAASKKLARIKQRHPDLFKSHALFYRALHLLQTCRYRSTVRSYILEQFDVPLDVKAVKSITEAGIAIRRKQAEVKKALAAVEAAKSDAASNEHPVGGRRLTIIDPTYRLDMDSDSSSTSSDDDEEEGSKAVKEVFEPMLVVKGFFPLV